MSDVDGRPLPSAPSGAARPSVIQLVFREKGALYAAYVSVFSDGGLFVPSTRDYQLGDDIYLLLSLPGGGPYSLAAKVLTVRNSLKVEVTTLKIGSSELSGEAIFRPDRHGTPTATITPTSSGPVCIGTATAVKSWSP